MNVGDVVAVSDGHDAPGVVQVPVGEQDGDRTKVVLGHHLFDRFRGAHAGVDDDAFGTLARAEHETVGAERSCWNPVTNNVAPSLRSPSILPVHSR